MDLDSIPVRTSSFQYRRCLPRVLADVSVFGALLAFVISSTARGQTYWWDGGGAGNSWGTRGNWGIGANNPDAPDAGSFGFGSDRVVVFNINDLNGSGSSVVSTLGDQRTIRELRFLSAGTVLIQPGGTGNFLRIAGGGITTGTGNNGTLTLDVRTVLTTNQTWDIGRTLIKQNPLDLGGNTLIVEGPGTSTFVGVIEASTGLLVKRGTGTLELQNINSHSGGTQINGGVLGLNSHLNLGSGYLAFGGGTVRIDANFAGAAPNQLAFNTNGTINTSGRSAHFGGIITGSGNLTKAGSGTLTLTGDASGYGGTIIVDGGTLDGTPSAIRGNVVNNSFVSIFGDGTYAGTMSGTGTLVKSGGGTIALTAANSFQGGTNLNGGVLLAANSNLGSGILTFNGGTLRLANAAPISRNMIVNAGGGTIDTNTFTSTVSGVISGSGQFTKTGWGTLILAGNNSYSGGTTVALGILQGNTSSLKGNFTNNAALFFDQSFDGVFSGNISGSGSLHKLGTGVLSLSTINTYAGNTNINAGVLSVQSDANLGSPSGLIVLHGGTLQLAPYFVSSRAIQLPGHGTIDTNGFGTTLNGAISGGGSFTKSGAGDLWLNGVNSYAGGTYLNGGRLFANDANLGTGNLSLNGGQLWATAPLNMSRNIFLGPAGGTIDTYSTNSHISSSITGAGNFRKSGWGTLTLGGTSSYSGNTFVDLGTLGVASPGALGNSPTITVAAGATLDVSGAATYHLTNGRTLTGGGAVVADQLSLLAGSALRGNLTIDGDVVNVGLLSPGTSTGDLGQISIFGNYEQLSSGVLEIEVKNTSLNQRDTLHVGGTANLGGTLVIDITSAAPEAIGFDPIEILSAQSIPVGSKFDAVDVVGDVDDSFSIIYLPNSVRIVKGLTAAGDVPYPNGDMNRDGMVTMADVPFFALALRNPTAYFSSRHTKDEIEYCVCGFPAETGDVNGDNRFDFDDIAGFANLVSGSGASAGEVYAALEKGMNPVPEPNSLLLIVTAIGILIVRGNLSKPQRRCA